jgi:hypothetical protein
LSPARPDVSRVALFPWLEQALELELAALDPSVQGRCSKYGGNLLEVTGYMVHVWSVPGYKSEQGTFSEVNPAITCPDGTYYRKTFDELGFSTTMCRGQ